jgi:hypothetical protein
MTCQGIADLQVQFEYTDQYKKYGVQELRKWAVFVDFTTDKKHSTSFHRLNHSYLH